MFVHKKIVELTEKINNLLEEKEEKREETESLEKEIKVKDFEIWKLKEKQSLEMEREKDKLRKDMQESLIESDLTRTEAVAKLNTYVDMDTKEERKHIQKMLEKAIEALGKQQVVLK